MSSRRGGGAPRRTSNGTRPLLAAAGVLVLLVSLVAGCSGSTPSDPASDEPGTTTSTGADGESTSPVEEQTTDDRSADPTDESATTSPAEDATTDAGDSDGDAGDAAQSEAQTLCDLTSEYVQTLFDNGTSSGYEYLDLAALSLGDSLKIWRGLVVEFPDSADDVDRAQKIYDLWQGAALSLSEGDSAAAEDSLSASQSEIDRLPAAADNDQVGCQDG